MRKSSQGKKMYYINVIKNWTDIKKKIEIFESWQTEGIGYTLGYIYTYACIGYSNVAEGEIVPWSESNTKTKSTQKALNFLVVLLVQRWPILTREETLFTFMPFETLRVCGPGSWRCLGNRTINGGGDQILPLARPKRTWKK